MLPPVPARALVQFQDDAGYEEAVKLMRELITRNEGNELIFDRAVPSL